MSDFSIWFLILQQTLLTLVVVVLIWSHEVEQRHYLKSCLYINACPANLSQGC